MLDDGHRVIAEAKAILAAKAIMPADVYKMLLHLRIRIATTDAKLKVRHEKAFQFRKEHERMLAKRPPPRPAGLPRREEGRRSGTRRKSARPSAQRRRQRRPTRPSRWAGGEPSQFRYSAACNTIRRRALRFS